MTHSFPFRFFTTVLGIIFVNTYHICTNAKSEYKSFKVHLNDIFYDPMPNKISKLPALRRRPAVQTSA